MATNSLLKNKGLSIDKLMEEEVTTSDGKKVKRKDFVKTMSGPQGAVPTLPSSSPVPATPITISPVPAKTSALSKLDISGSNAIANMNKARASVVDREKAIRGGSALGSMGLNTIGSIGKTITATGDVIAGRVAAEKAEGTVLAKEMAEKERLEKVIKDLSYQYAHNSIGLANNADYQFATKKLASLNRVIDAVKNKVANETEDTKADRAMNNLLGISDELRKTSLEGLSPTGQMIGSTAMSLGESAMLMPTALINPYLYRSLSAAKNAGRTMYDKEQQGYSEGDAYTRGLLSGGVTFGTSKLGLDAALKGMTGKALAQGGFKGAVANRLLGSAGEGLEGGIEYTADTFLDKAYGEDKKWSGKDFLTQAALEGIGSLAIGGAMDIYGGLNAIPATKATTLSDAEKNLKPLAEREADAYREVVEPVRQRHIEEQQRAEQERIKAETEKLNAIKSQAYAIADTMTQLEENGLRQPEPVSPMFPDEPIKVKKPRTKKGNPKTAKNRANTQVMPNVSRYVDVYDRVTNAVNGAKATGNYDAISDVSDIIIKEEMKRFVDMVDNGATETDLIKEGEFWGEAIKNNKKKDGATKDRFLVFSRIKGFYEPTSLSDNYKLFKSILNDSTPTSDTNTTLQKNLDEVTKVAEEQKKMADEITKINSDVINVESAQPSNKALGIVNKDSLNIFSRLKRMADKLYQGTVSGQSPLEKMQRAADKKGQNSEIDAYTQLARQAGGTVDTILEKALYDSQGNKLSDRSFESIVKAIPKEKRQAFNDYMQNKHNISRMTLEERFKNVKNKDVNGKTADESRQIVAEHEKNNPEFVQYAKDLREFWNTFTKAWLVDTGVLSQEQFDVMQKMYPDYIPTFRTDKANKASGGIWGRSVNTPNNIKKATGATSEIVPLEESFATLIDRMVRAARKNDLGKAVATFADMDSELAAHLGVAVAEDVADMDFDSLQSMFDDDVNETLKQLENGDYTLSYYDNGKKKTLNISQNVFDSFRLLQNASGIENETKQMVYEGVKALTAPMKSAITGSNPVFALANVARDIQTYAINSTGNPVTVTSNWFKALAQTFTGSEKLDQYYAMGNSRSGYFDTSGSMSKSIENNKTFKEKTFGEKAKAMLTSPVRGANAFNERIETTTRYAEYLNNIKKYGDTPEGRRKAALAAADVTVNFSRSGPLTKTADAGTMYLNAGVQGLDNFARHLAKNPGKVALKGALSLALPQLILSWWNKDNPNYKELNTRTKDTYFCIPNMADLDENGNAKTFIKLPKTQQYGVWFATFVDRIFNAVEKGQETGDYETAAKDAFEGFGKTVTTNFSPTSPITGNIFAPIAINLPSNKDFAGRNIVSPSFINNNMPDEYQYDATTSNFAKRMAQITQGLPDDGVLSHLKSPQKIDYLLDSYTGIVGDEIQAITAPENKGKTIGETAANTFYNSLVGPFKQRFIADPLYSSALTDEIYKNIDETAEVASRVNIENSLPSDARTIEEFQNGYFDTAASTISELRKKEQDILKAPGSYAEKQQAITENRKQMAEVARNFLNNSESIFAAISNDVSAMQNSELFVNMSKKEQDKALDALYDYSAIKYRESFKPGYSSENDAKIDTIKAGDFTTAEAILYKQTLDNIKSKDEKADFIQQLDITEKQKDLLEDTLISDWITIPNEVDRTYTSGAGALMDENYVLSGMGKEANKAWPILKAEGMGVEEFVDVANIMSSGKKKAEILDTFKEMGYVGTVIYKDKSMDLSEMIYKTFKDKSKE